MLTAKEALADIESKSAAPLYYLYGDEPFKIFEFVEKAQTALFGPASGGAEARSRTDDTFCVDRIDGTTATGADVLDAVQSMGLFGGSGSRRLVIVRQAHLLKDVDGLADVVMAAASAPKKRGAKDAASGPWGENLLLCADALDGRRKFHQWLKKQDLALEFKPARDAELFQWIQYLGKKTGATISRPAAELLAAISEGSLYRLAQEIEKAWLYAGAQAGAVIDEEHVAGVAAGQASHELVELVRAILEKKKARAMLLSEKLIRGPDDALGLVGFLTWALKSSGRAGFTGQLAGGPTRRQSLVRGLVELDLRLKTTGADPAALVELFVVEQTA